MVDRGLGMWWKDIGVNVISYSMHHFAIDILDENSRAVWRAIGIYGWPKQSNKHLTWSLMSSLYVDCNLPCVMFGDFNEISSQFEKEGGPPRSERMMDAFREAIDNCTMRDLGYTGNIFTWERGNSMEIFVRERLDRFIATEDRCTLFPECVVKNLPILKSQSDHALIVLTTENHTAGFGGHTGFKFEALWLSNEECGEVVGQGWRDSVGCSMASRVAICSEKLASWAALTFGLVKKRIKKGEKRLSELKRGAMDAAKLEMCNSLSNELDELYKLEESYWHARARVNELRDGDKNTKYFHHKASQRKAHNRIVKLKDDNGDWFENQVDIERLIEAYFARIFATSAPMGIPEALEGIEEVVSEEMNDMLNREPIDEEIKHALFQMHPNKAPGPDGSDIINFVKKMVEKGGGPVGLANKLKVVLNKVISVNQSAFIPRRLISDNALVAFEIFHAMKRGGEGKDGSFALKLDMIKSYDRVEWVFLERVMDKMGFSGAWISRIMSCLQSVKFAFKINGQISGDGLLHGARICRGAPRISHLFFADDSILFAKAKTIECSVIANIISKYERASGQKINTLGVREVNRNGKYLGLPTIIGRSKRAIFAGIKERIWKILQGWTAKLLSNHGKEILIKAVAQAIPTYIMGILRIPDGIVDEIHSLLARFWWGSTSSIKRLHWQKWEELCRPKSIGGLGFRDLRCFNQALLAKQLWRLHHDRGSLVHAIMKVKYFKNCDVLEAARGYDPSYTWRSLWGAKSLLLEGLKWRVENGCDISVWDCAWLPSNSSVCVPTPLENSDMGLRVSDLIDHETMSWRQEVLADNFNMAEQTQIQSIPLSFRCVKDRMFWWPARCGKYSVKSGYWLAKHGPATIQRQPQDEIWRIIWSMKIPPKLAHFLWRACKGFLVVRERLALIEQAPDSSFCERFLWLASKTTSNELRSIATLTWAAWWCRNKVVFEHEDLCPISIASNLAKSVQEYADYAKKVFMYRGAAVTPAANAWSCPSVGVVKVNCDAYVGRNVGLGVVIRDANGSILAAAVKRGALGWSAEIAEAAACRYGLQLATRLDYSAVVLESDAYAVTQGIKTKPADNFTPFSLIIDNVCYLSRFFTVFSVSHVKRAGNTLAHHVSRWNTYDCTERVCLGPFPQSLLTLAEIDLL
ncbi:uncharacterized protein LOC110734577 [Chenopodium quinoa]|uniref:uncharacterized protein LOC110734577 n=1 Tax=Chenopodium quinoa TaxID=63459 RepID=UPI000B76C52D|nr:uncharacterized protein LOC110734577 [Chenopodium quinoa]